MRPAFKQLFTLALGAAVALPAAASAQTIPSPYTFVERTQEAGVFAGYMDATTGRFGYGPSGGPWLGARYALRLTGPMGLEGVAGLVTGTRDIVDPNRAEGDRVIGEGDVTITTLEARLRFSATGDRAWHRLSPFLFLGAGVAFDVASAPELEEALEERDVFDFGTSFFGTLGVGTRWFLTERFALRADGTFSLWRLSTPPGFSDVDRGFLFVDDSEWERGLSATISLLYRW